MPRIHPTAIVDPRVELADDVEIEALDDVVNNKQEEFISELIDIRQPLINLKHALERKVGLSLANYEFWLQDSQQLPDNTTLVEQCVQGKTHFHA